MLITQSIANLLNGVSQRAQEQRLSSQGQEQINAVSSRVRGLMQRPPTVYGATLLETIDEPYDGTAEQYGPDGDCFGESFWILQPERAYFGPYGSSWGDGAIGVGYDGYINEYPGGEPGDFFQIPPEGLHDGTAVYPRCGALTGPVDPEGWDEAFIYSLDRGEGARFHITIVDGELKAFNAATGAEVQVFDLDNYMAYLEDADAGYRATSFGDTTIIVNRSTEVGRGEGKAAAAVFEALLYIRQADYGTSYSVTLNGFYNTITTPSGATPTSRPLISTDYIAQQLYSILAGNTNLSGFQFSLYGSTIYLTRTDGADFTLSTSDGLADGGLRAIKGSVQAFTDLPRKAKNGFIVEIAGDAESDQDNYWVRFDDSGNPDQGGTWNECPQPGTMIELDASTLPHRLVLGGKVYEGLVHEDISLDPLAATIGIGTDPADEFYAGWSGGFSYSTGSGTVWSIGSTGDQLSYTFGADASQVRFAVGMIMNAINMADPNQAFVEIAINGVVYDIVGSIAGTIQYGYNSFTPIVYPFQSGDELTITMHYITEFGDVNPSPGAGFTVDGLLITNASDTFRSVSFQRASYPVGTLVTITAGTTAFPYTVTGSPATGADLATYFATTIDADVDYEAEVGSPAYVVKIKNATGSPFDLTATVVLDEDTTFYDSTQAFVAGSLVDYIIVNRTDNSQGTIVSNTETTIVVSALTGGADNEFNNGDLIDVLGPEGTPYFVFQPCPWAERKAGDLSLVPFPSFDGKAISDVFFYKNRLGFLSEENAILSQAGGEFFNFFRQSAVELFADDVIDVRSAHAKTTLFHSAFLWNKGLYFLSSNGLWQMSGEPVLSPQTVRVDFVADIPNSPDCKPVVLGNKLYVGREKGSFTQVQQLAQTGVNEDGVAIVSAADVTENTPSYIRGQPLLFTGDGSLGFFVVLTDNDDSADLFVMCYTEGSQGLTQLSWSKWQFETGQVIGIDMVDGHLGLLVVETDSVMFYTMDLSSALAPESARRLDRLVYNPPAAYADGDTIWTLPYTVATDGSEGEVVIVNPATGVEYTVTRPSNTTVSVAGQDLSEASVDVGIRSSSFEYTFSRIFFRNKDEEPELGGRLTLRYMKFLYQDSTSFSIEVTLQGRATRTYTFAAADPAVPESGEFKVPIQGKNEYADIVIRNSGPGSCAFTSVDWEGDFSIRARRV